MEPIEPTQDAIDEHGPFSYQGDDLLPRIQELSEQVRQLVPTCVGLSLSLVDLGVTFTLVATDAQVAALDAVQYVDGGPCVAAIDAGETVSYLTEQQSSPADRWSLFSRASVERGVRSTLSLPLVLDGSTVGGFNLYGATRGAFDGHHDDLADLLGAWSGGAITDRDLSFRSREVAAQAPAILGAAAQLAVAQRLLQRARGFPADEAERRLRGAAVRAGTSLVNVVDTVVAVLGTD